MKCILVFLVFFYGCAMISGGAIKNSDESQNRDENDPPDASEVNGRLNLGSDIKGLQEIPAGVSHGAAIRTSKKWQSQRGGKVVVPYSFGSSFPGGDKVAILQGIALINEHLKCGGGLKARTTERDYIRFIRDNGCYSYLGKRGGAQPISIGRGCGYRGIVAHEILHALGFGHEQTRPDRDQHVNILFQNIQSGMEHNFKKLPGQHYFDLKSKYDYDSVMQYSAYAFSNNGRPTIIRKNGGTKLGQRNGLSPIDIQELNDYFGCSKTSTTKSPATTKSPTTTKTTIPPPPTPGPEEVPLTECRFDTNCRMSNLNSMDRLSWMAQVKVDGEYVAELVKEKGTMTKGIGYTTVRRKSRCRRRNEIVKFCVRISHERTIKSGILYVGLRNYGKMNLKWHELTASVNEWKTDMYQFTGYCSTVYVYVYAKKGLSTGRIFVKEFSVTLGECSSS